MIKNTQIEYKVKLDTGSSKPLSIARRIIKENTYLIEICNEHRNWTISPDSISYWTGSSDEGWHSPPDGEDMPQEFIEKWLKKWEENWSKNS